MTDSIMSLITKLSDYLMPKLGAADELWVAVGLINLHGLNFLLDNTPAKCTRNFLLGIDLPTDPAALHKLNELQGKPNLRVRLFTDQEFFHPKMYLVRSNSIFSGFVGSANCTNGGLHRNIELTLPIDDQIICADLKLWFEERFELAKHLTSSFVEEYHVRYSERLQRQLEDREVMSKLKKKRNTDRSIKDIEESVKIEMASFPPLASADASPIEEAWKVRYLREAGYSRKEIMKEFTRTGGHKGLKRKPVSNSFINMRESFLKLPKAIQDKIHDRRVGVKVAYKLTKVKNEPAAVLTRAEAANPKRVRAEDIGDADTDIWYERRLKGDAVSEGLE